MDLFNPYHDADNQNAWENREKQYGRIYHMKDPIMIPLGYFPNGFYNGTGFTIIIENLSLAHIKTSLNMFNATNTGAWYNGTYCKADLSSPIVTSQVINPTTLGIYYAQGYKSNYGGDAFGLMIEADDIDKFFDDVTTTITSNTVTYEGKPKFRMSIFSDLNPNQNIRLTTQKFTTMKWVVNRVTGNHLAQYRYFVSYNNAIEAGNNAGSYKGFGLQWIVKTTPDSVTPTKFPLTGIPSTDITSNISEMSNWNQTPVSSVYYSDFLLRLYDSNSSVPAIVANYSIHSDEGEHDEQDSEEENSNSKETVWSRIVRTIRE